jgi:antitoxin CptB
MLELDIALGRFLDLEYATLDATGRKAFARLLQVEDQVLFEWLMGGGLPDDSELLSLVERLRTPGRGRGPGDA